MNFCVITRIPDSEKGESGNLAVALPLYLETEQPSKENDYRGKFEPVVKLMGMAALSLRAPVFALGEILVVDESGREIGGIARKPSKWDIDYEEYDTVEEAVAKAIELRGY